MKEGGGRNRKEREKEGKEGGEEGGEGRGRREKGRRAKERRERGEHWCQQVYKLRRQISRTYCTGPARLPGLVDRYTEEHR